MRPKIGLVLGGGGSRGVAHVGVLQVLARENIPIDLIVGTSMGGIVGAFFAGGCTSDRLLDCLEPFRGNAVLNMNIFSARARQRTLRTWLHRTLAGFETFADLSIPLIVSAVDMLQGREVAISEGPLIPALLATSAMPAVFPPVDWEDMRLADGGVIDSLATHLAFKHGAERVIAVDIYPALDEDNPWVDPVSAIMGVELPFNLLGSTNDSRPPSMLASIWRSRRIITWHLHQTRLDAHRPHVLLRPAVDSYSSLDFKDLNGPLQAGIAAAERHIDAIRALVADEDAEPDAKPG